MGPAHYVVMALRAIGLLMGNPALGGGSQLKAVQIQSLTDMLATLVEGGENTREELKRFAIEVETLAASGMPPSRGQWDSLIARDRAARAILAARKAELSRPPVSPPAPEPEKPSAGPSEPLAGSDSGASGEPDPGLSGVPDDRA